MTGVKQHTHILLGGISAVALLAADIGVANAQTVLDPITIIASKTQEKVSETLAGVSTVQQGQINQIMPKRTSEIFFGMPSVWFQERADDQGTSINIRGLQDFGRVAVVIDGARQNFQRSGHNADGLFYVEPEMLAGADVVRGPVANIYGSGAIGGVVSMRTKDVDDVLKPGQRWGFLTNGEIGSNKLQALGSTFGAVRINPNVEFMAGGSYRDRSNFKDGNGNEVLNSATHVSSEIAKLTVRPADGHEVKFSGLAYESLFNNGTPNAANNATVYQTDVKNYVTSARWKYSRPEDRIFDFDGNVYWTRTDTEQVKIAGTNSAISGRLGQPRTFTIDTTGFDLNNTSRFETGPFRHALTYGGDWFRDSVNVVDATGTGDLFTPNGERNVGGAFAQLKTNFGSWLELQNAIRYDSYDLSGGGASSSGDRISPKTTIGITPVPWLTIYGTYAEGYRAPAVTEVFVAGQHPNAGPGSAFVFLPNTSLTPEIGKTKEVGVNIRQDNLITAGDSLRIKANIFRNDVSNFIEQVSVAFNQPGIGGAICPAADNCIQYQNITNARLEGAEFEGMYDAGYYFIGLAGTHIRGKNTETGAPLLKIQPDQLATTIGARFLDKKLTAAVRWLAVDAKKRSDIPSGTIPPTDAYSIVNLYLGYQPNEDVTLSFGIDNLFNKYYARYLDVTTSGATVLPSPSPGITYKGSLRVRFGDSFYRPG